MIDHPPKPTGAKSASLAGVSCAASSACIVVGSYTKRGDDHPLVERWNGSRWTIQRTPALRSDGDLNAVSCSSRTACTAVGYYYMSTGNFRRFALVERWNGRRWRTESTPTLPPPDPRHLDPDVNLLSVSCSSRRACVAVGHGNQPPLEDDLVAVAERWDGTSWTVQKSNVENDLTGVSCTSARWCMAVGFTSIAGFGFSSNLDHWDGLTWTSHEGAIDGLTLTGISCKSVTFCLAVGNVDFAGSRTARWNGKKWILAPAPGPLASVACVSSRYCVAAGTTENTDHLRIEHWNGSRWATDTTPAPLRTSLASISCTTRSVCIAVGQSTCDPTASEPACDPLAARTTTAEREDSRLRRQQTEPPTRQTGRKPGPR